MIRFKNKLLSHIQSPLRAPLPPRKDNNNMIGILPQDTFIAITTFSEIDLAYNKIHGSLPSYIYESPIKTMKLNGNIDLGGIIFNDDFFKLSDTLEMIDLENDDFEGDIPSKIKDFMNLRVLRLGRNRIAGTIPSEISYLTNLGKQHGMRSPFFSISYLLSLTI